MKRSTTPAERWSSVSDSPTMRDARSVASVPTSERAHHGRLAFGIDLRLCLRDDAVSLAVSLGLHLGDDLGALFLSLGARRAASARPSASRF